MKLTKIKLNNYRCFGEEQILEISDLTTFIGQNSSGKTAALSAINLMFSSNSNERILKRSDFHLPKGTRPEQLDKQSLYIETVFEFDELKSETGDPNYAIPTFFEHFVVGQEGEVPYLRIRLEATWEKSTTLEGSIESKIYYIVCAENQSIEETDKKDARRKELDQIRVIYVPAIRNPSKELKNVSGTMMHQIMSGINWNGTKDIIKSKIDDLNEEFKKNKGVSIIGNSIKEEWVNYDSDSRYKNAILKFNSTDIDSSIKNSQIVFSPTVTEKEYDVDEMGDGLRSLFYISMVDSILDIESTILSEPDSDAFTVLPPSLTIIAVEEPENHISPQLLGKLINNLIGISKKSGSQIILTSHSASIVRRVSPNDLRYFRFNIDEEITKVHKITLPNEESSEAQYKYVKEAVIAFPELYFASLVVLGEGDSEMLIFPKVFESLEIEGYESISFVPLGGRYVNHFWRLLNDLNIPHITVLDLDRERDGGDWGRIKYAIKQLLLYRPDIKTDLLKIDETNILTETDLEEMHNWDSKDYEKMQFWIKRLETYNVFYSSPLDIDFLMLENFENEYKSTLEDSEGPCITVCEEGKNKKIKISELSVSQLKSDEYNERIANDLRHTLKENGGDGCTYSENQKQLMIWYNYFFLNRGKPSTHLLAQQNIKNPSEEYKKIPLFKKITEISIQLLDNGGENNESNGTTELETQ